MKQSRSIKHLQFGIEKVSYKIDSHHNCDSDFNKDELTGKVKPTPSTYDESGEALEYIE